MQLRIYGKNAIVARSELRLATEIMLAQLLSKRMLKHISLYIRQKRGLTLAGLWAVGLLYGRNHRDPPRDFTLWLSTDPGKYAQLHTLAHELAHLKQYATGECKTMKNGSVRWQHNYVNDTWSDPFSPWEIDANGHEYALYEVYMDSTRLSGRPGTARRRRVRRVP